MQHPPSGTKRVSADALRTFTAAILTRAGVAPADAAVAADVLLDADLGGIDTHGISRLKYYVDRLDSGITRAEVKLTTISETPTTAVLDANLSLGHPAASRAMDLAIRKAETHGLGAVAVRNATHFGVAGHFALQAAARDMIGIATTNARPAVAPTFSTQPLFGTNPWAFAAPSDEPFPFCFDAALSIVQRGNIEVMARSGEPLPEGWAVDRAGHPVTDPRELLRKMNTGDGALLPLGGSGEAYAGYKGYGLAIMIEILCAALQQGDFLSALAGGVEAGQSSSYRLGHFFLAMNISSFTEPAAFRKTVGGIARELRAAEKAPGAGRIWTAGEKEWEMRMERTAKGIPVPEALVDELAKLGQRFHVAFPAPG